jgi:hypothetical protein
MPITYHAIYARFGNYYSWFINQVKRISKNYRTIGTRIFLKIDNSTLKNSNVTPLGEIRDPNKFDSIITNPTHSILVIKVSVNVV